MKKLPFIFLSLVSFAVKSQSAITKNTPFTEKTLEMPESVIVKYEEEAPAVYSNAKNTAQFAFENTNRQKVNFLLFNGENKEVPVMYAKTKTGIEETITVYTGQLAVGTYVCKVETGSTTVTRKLIVAR